MILYFSGTGNSRYAARRLAEQLKDEAVSINTYLKEEKQGVFESSRPYVFVMPTYAWQMPRVVVSFLKNARLSGSRKAYFVLTCGGSVGNAAETARRLCEEKGLVFQGLEPVVMPDNYLVMFPVPGREECRRMVEKAVPVLDGLAALIGEDKPFSRRKAGLVGRLESGPVNALFYRYQISPKKFRVKESCVGCGKCAQLCPLNNVHLENSRPQWGDHCTHCMACISVCPVQAIEYGKGTEGKNRYYLD